MCKSVAGTLVTTTSLMASLPGAAMHSLQELSDALLSRRKSGNFLAPPYFTPRGNHPVCKSTNIVKQLPNSNFGCSCSSAQGRL